MAKEPTRTLSDDTFASNPGGVRLQWWTWLRHYPESPLWLAGGLLGCAIGLGYALVNWQGSWQIGGAVAFGTVFVLILFANRFYWTRQAEHMRHGDANPGLVISMRPMLYAVRTDLTQGFGSFPVVVITKTRFRPVLDAPARVGTRIMTVALYSAGNDELRHWVGFEPLPVDCATRSKPDVRAVFETVHDEDWAELERVLEQVPQPYRPGIYAVDKETSSWAETRTWRLLKFVD